MIIEVLTILSAVVGAVTIAAFIVASAGSSLRDIYLFFFRKEKLIREQYAPVIKQAVMEVCAQLGVPKQSRRYKSFRLYLESIAPSPRLEETYEAALRDVIAHATRPADAQIGVRSEIHYRYYVDLRGLLTDPNMGEALGSILVAFIRRTVRDKQLHFNYVACHREGSAILGYAVAFAFGAPLLLVSRTSRWRLAGKSIVIEGAPSQPDDDPSSRVVAVVDDSVSGGAVLLDTVEKLTSEGFEVRDAFVLFQRQEDVALKRLAERGVTLHSVLALDDSYLQRLLESGTAPRTAVSVADKPAAPPETDVLPYDLKRLNLYVNLTCPQRCKHCCVGPRLNHHTMSWADAVTYIQKASRKNNPVREIMILGGEPAMYDDLDQVVASARRAGIAEVSICTSGVHADKLVGMPGGVTRFVVSLDGFTSRSHDAVRGEGSYDTAMRALRCFREAGYPVRIILTANSLNLGEIPDGLRQMENLGVQQVNFHLVSETGFARQNRYLLVSPGDWITARQTIETYSGPMAVKYPLRYATSDEFRKEIEWGYSCMLANIDRLNILPGGECYACCLFLDTRLGCGSIGKGGFRRNQVSEETIHAAGRSLACPAMEMVFGFENKQDLVPLCIHWKRTVGSTGRRK